MCQLAFRHLMNVFKCKKTVLPHFLSFSLTVFILSEFLIFWFSVILFILEVLRLFQLLNTA